MPSEREVAAALLDEIPACLKRLARRLAADQPALGHDALNRAVREAILHAAEARLWADAGSFSAEVLGQVYERLLEKEVRIAADGRAVLTAARQRNRAAGVYYTPGYVVDYIVRKAVGPRLAGFDPTSTAPLKILDPACGAGSFLLGTYRFLLDWHRDFYTTHSPEDHAQKHDPRLCHGQDGRWHLTTAERKRILLGSVFGVDLDPQAVEVAKRALAFTMRQDAPRPQSEAPCDLGSNMVCGDSLLDFEAVMPAGQGFDVVLGNPPYRRERGSKPLLTPLDGTAFAEKYRAARMDLWYYFAHRGLELLRPGGVLSFIVSAYWTAGAGAERLVASLQRDAHLEELFLLDDLPVFPKVAGRHLILRVVKGRSDGPTTIKRAPSGSAATAEAVVHGMVPLRVVRKSAAQLFRAGRIDLEPPADSLLARLDRWPPLGELAAVRQGIAENPASINARTNAAFGNRWQVGQGVFALRPAEVERLDLSAGERALLRPYYDVGDVARYHLADHPSLELIYSTKRTCPDIGQFPRIKAHLEPFRTIMEARRETRQGSNRWWHLHWPRDEAIWQSPKILCLQFARRPSLVAVRGPGYVPFSVNVAVPRATTREGLDYLAALLNSRLLWTWFEHHAKRRGVGLEINGRVLARAPIRAIDFSRPEERARHEEITRLAGSMSALTRRRRDSTAGTERAALAEQIDVVDRRIDRLVYDLYGLTDEEVAQVEDK